MSSTAKHRAVVAMQALMRLAWECERTDTSPERRGDAARRIDAALHAVLGNTVGTLDWVAVVARVLDAGDAVRGGADLDRAANAVRRTDPDLRRVPAALVREAVQDAARGRPGWKSILALLQAAGLAREIESADSLRGTWGRLNKRGVPAPYRP